MDPSIELDQRSSKGWIVCIALVGATIKSRAVIRIEARASLEPFGQVWVGDEGTAKSNRVGFTLRESFTGIVGVESTCQHDFSLEQFSKQLSRSWCIA